MRRSIKTPTTSNSFSQQLTNGAKFTLATKFNNKSFIQPTQIKNFSSGFKNSKSSQVISSRNTFLTIPHSSISHSTGFNITPHTYNNHKTSFVRYYSSSEENAGTEQEAKLKQMLTEELNPVACYVRDVSGGCGAMFQIYIAAEIFKGKPTVKRHRMVNEILKDEIENMHGLTLKTNTLEQHEKLKESAQQ
eukprot:gb/GECH01000286.1/.p1 GENE.gb/GECH01000286.1/~~gb/GECH01000286.1/.p1  ORF type:complete len:191 (+),score=54.20 gb/GECH01000286.1/:1-573(+)